jgi:hypothetical protein
MHFNSISVKATRSNGLAREISGGSQAFRTRSGAMRCTVITLLALIACKEKPPAPPPPTPLPPHDGVTVLQPGAPPHQALRYRLIKGARTRSELVCDVDLRSDDHTGPMPTLVVDFETQVTDVLADGTAQLRITVIGTTVRDRPGSATAGDLVRAQAAAMHGVVFTETLAPDGALGEPRLEATALSDKVRGQLESLTRSLQQVAMRMPQEPVGLGAMWRERRTLPEGGIRAVSETTYTLTSLTGDTVGYLATGVASGAPQTIEQDGLKAEVTSTSGSSEAKGTVDLSRYAIAVSSTSKLTTTMNVEAPEGTPGGGPSTIEVTLAVQVTPSSAPLDDAAAAAPTDPPINAPTPPINAPTPPINAPTPPTNAPTAPTAPTNAPTPPTRAEPAGSNQGAQSAP